MTDTMGMQPILPVKQCSDQAKAKIFFDVCRLFFDLFRLFFGLFRFRVRFLSVWADLTNTRQKDQGATCQRDGDGVAWCE